MQTRRQVNRKKSKSRKLKHGGTLFEINNGQLENLLHIGQPVTPGEYVSCAACTMNKLGFPEDLVNIVSTEANKNGYGLFFERALEVINILQRRRDPKKSPASMYFWAMSSHGLGSSQLTVDPHNQRNMTNIDETMEALTGIIQTMAKGTAAVLSMTWVTNHPSGHFNVIAKSNRGTPYIIETQHGGFEGVYRGWDQVKNYFQRNLQVGKFVTYNNSKPEFDQKNKEWILPKSESVIPINSTNLRLGNYTDNKRLIHADPNRNTITSRLQRSDSFRTIKETTPSTPPASLGDPASNPSFDDPLWRSTSKPSLGDPASKPSLGDPASKPSLGDPVWRSTSKSSLGDPAAKRRALASKPSLGDPAAKRRALASKPSLGDPAAKRRALASKPSLAAYKKYEQDLLNKGKSLFAPPASPGLFGAPESPNYPFAPLESPEAAAVADRLARCRKMIKSLTTSLAAYKKYEQDLLNKGKSLFAYGGRKSKKKKKSKRILPK